MKKRPVLRVFLFIATIGLTPGMVMSASLGNPHAGNGWDSSTAIAVGNPTAVNGWNTTSAVSIRAFSSEKASRPWERTIDGSGLNAATGLLHDTSYNTVGFSGLAAENVARGGTVSGYVWVEYDLGAGYELGEMWIWNYNELNFPHFGMNEVTIEYSTTGSGAPADWTTIYDSYIPLAAGAGLSPSPVDLKVDFAGATARYIVITTELPPFHNHRPTYEEVGLGEVRFHLPAAVTTTAASEWATNRVARNTINGTGITEDGALHSNNYYEMWLSGDLAASAAHPNPGTVTGSHWIRYDFNQSYDLAQMWIWNYNELNFPIIGMKDVTIQYSNLAEPNDPVDWQTAFTGTIPMATAGSLDNSPVDLKVNFGGVPVRHVVITTVADHNKNWSYDDPNENYQESVGLSEVRFFTVPQTCAEAIADGHGLATDGDGNCYVDLKDFALFSKDWLDCLNPEDENCVLPWE